jgi:hypothetical protein
MYALSYPGNGAKSLSLLFIFEGELRNC